MIRVLVVPARNIRNVMANKKIATIFIILLALALIGGSVFAFFMYKSQSINTNVLNKNLKTSTARYTVSITDAATLSEVSDVIDFTFINDITDEPMSNTSINVKKWDGVICETVNCMNEISVFKGITDSAGKIDIPHSVCSSTTVTNYRITIYVNDNGSISFSCRPDKNNKFLISSLTSDIDIHLIKE